jgi:outer membrane immunogenic protein
MKRILLAGISVLALISSAPAADLPRGGPVPYKAPAYMPMYNWTGFYLGINGGGAWGRSSWDAYGAGSTSPSGGMIGATAGYNWQGGSPWVFGLEGDIDWTSVNGGGTACGVGVACESKNSWLATIRGRVGYSWDRFLPYVTGGLALGDIQVSRTAFGGSTETKAGWTIGTGIEGVIVGRWTGKIEYLYADLGSTNCSAASCGGTGVNVDMHMHILRAGVNYRF